MIFGKTNTPAMAGDWQTYNTIFGTSNNPGTPLEAPAVPLAAPRRRSPPA